MEIPQVEAKNAFGISKLAMDWSGWGFRQLGLMEDIPDQGRSVELR